MQSKHLSVILLLAGICILVSCNKARTKHLLLNKVWEVYDVTPPETGNFDIDATNEAQDLKNGFYQHATFEFFNNNIFRTNFGGKLDSGDYSIGPYGKIISLYPLHGDKMYEQIQIQHISKDTMAFNTLISHFYMTLHLHNIKQE